MALRFYIGASGSGKSHCLYQEIIKRSMENPKQNYLIVVPDQFTMQTQKDICLMHPNKGIMNIDVLSFGRLSHRIFEEVGRSDKIVLDDTGKNLVLRKIAQEKENELKVMKTQLKKPGYIHEIKSSISEFMQYGIGTKELEKLIDFSKKKGSLSYKLEDLNTLYQGFLSYIKEKYITSEETLVLLKELLKKSVFIKESVIIFDGFTGFTPVQNEVIKELMTLVNEVIVTVISNQGENSYVALGEQELFYLGSKTIQSLEKIAQEAGMERNRAADVLLRQNPVFRYRENQELAHLEEGLFRYPLIPYPENCKNIFLRETYTMEEEVRKVAIQINELVRREDYKYQDIAVITGDLNAYSHLIERAFEKYQVPHFLDQNRGILLNPFIEYIKGALEVVLQGYSYETIFHFLRSGMTDFNIEEIDELENYVLALGIKGKKKWNERWVRKSADMGEDFSEELERLNTLREKLVNLLSPLFQKGKSAAEITIYVYEFLVASNLQKKLTAYETMFLKENKMALAKEYGQIYAKVIDLLDQIQELLGEEKVTVQEYAQILYAGFDEIQIGIIPQNVDQVVIGDMERTRLREIKALFFIGLNDGIIPQTGGSGGIISDIEREFLKESKFELAPSPRQQMYRQRLYLYMNMTKPKEYLYLSYAKLNGEGKSQRPSYLIGIVEKLFPQLLIEQIKEERLKDCLVSPKDGVDYLAKMLREYAAGKQKKEEELFTLYRWYQNSEGHKATVKQLSEAAFYHYAPLPLSKAVSNVIYGTVLENSVSRLEQYAACAYSHFLKYGLELFPRAEYSFERVDMGNIFHGVLERFSEKLVQSNYTWFDFPKEAGDSILEEALNAYATEYGETILYSSARNEYLIRRMQRILKRTIYTLQYQLKKGLFTPGNFELSFSVLQDLESVNIALSKEERMRLKGRIDRVDTYEDEENVYVKVVDYKSGNVSFDLVALYHGLQLQLVVYLNAALELERKKHPDKKVLPAAVFYYHMDDPCIATEGKELSEEAINQAILEKLKMNGIMSDKADIVNKMDTSLTTKSDIIPIEYKKDGSFSAASAVMSDESLTQISGYVNRKIKEIGRGILDGNIEVNPYELTTKNACTYCNYKAVCGFDPKIEGYKSRELDTMSKEEAMEKIKKDAEKTE